ncbi:MAG: hypothetical protein RLZZ488_733 [Pseudomonadota bacterium]|jgi:hypothetical protein
MIKFLSLLCSAILLASCKPPVPNDSKETSITPRGKVVGKWLATLSIGGKGFGKQPTEYLANTLKEVFLSEVGGNYKLAFDLSDQSNWHPSKKDIQNRFSQLRANISQFKAKNPNAPTMIVLGLTGHGASQQAFKEIDSGYVYSISEGNSETKTPPEYLTGNELAELVASLGAEEVLMFVQSCNSGNLSNVEFMNKYARVLANETARKKTNIAVITPVSEVIFSPIYTIENAFQKAFIKAAQSNGDVATYAQFKDAFVRAVCEDPQFYPRSQIKSLEAVQASVELLDMDTLTGIDPQFYESIDPNLPLLLTFKSIPKYKSGTLTFPARSAPSNNVAVSEETRRICAERISSRAKVFTSLEQRRQTNLKELKACNAAANRDKCIADVLGRKYGIPDLDKMDPPQQPVQDVSPVKTPMPLPSPVRR